MDRRYSLKKNKEFRYVYARGASVSSKNIVLVFRKKKTPALKVGFSVSKKVGKSVVRNLVKRRLKDAFNRRLSKVDKRTLIIIIAKPCSAQARFADLLRDMQYLLKKAGLYLIDN